MLYYGTNKAWGETKRSGEILKRGGGIWVATPYDKGSDGAQRYVVSVVGTTDIQDNAPELSPVVTSGNEPEWKFNFSYNKTGYFDKDGLQLYVYNSLVGSIAWVDVYKYCDVVTKDNLSEWLSDKTKADIDAIKNASIIRYDIYLDGTNKPAITTHFSNSGTTPLTFDFVVSPFGSDTIDDEYKNTSWENGISNLNKDVSLKLALSSANNKGGWYKSWVDLDNETFNKWNKAMKVIHNGFSTNYSSSDYYVIASRVRNETTAETTTSDFFYVIIPSKTPQSAEQIVVNYGTVGGDMVADIEVHIHLNEKVPDDYKDDISNTSDDGSAPWDNSTSGDNDTDKTSDINDGTGTATTGLLTCTYALTSERCRLLGQKLWTQAYFDILKVQDNPIQNIVSIKAFPFSMSGTDGTIMIGNVDMGVNGEKLATNVKRIAVGSIKFNEYYHNFLDFSPFTSAQIFLPYIGFKQVDLNKVLGKTVNVEYIVDLLTGACRARLFVNGLETSKTLVAEYDGTMGIDIPLASSDRAQLDTQHLMSVASSFVGGAKNGAIGAAEGVITGIANALTDNYNSSATGGSPCVSSYDTNTVFVIFDRPTISSESENGFAHTFGLMCNQFWNIGKLSGYTEISNIDLSGMMITEQEETEIRNILKNGFYA